MRRALLALTLSLGLGNPMLHWAAGLVQLALSATAQTDYGGLWDPNGGAEPDYGNHWDPNG